MPTGWMGIRWTISRRSLTVIALASAFTLSLRIFFAPLPFQSISSHTQPASDQHFEIVLDFGPTIDWVNGPGDFVALDSESRRVSAPATAPEREKAKAQGRPLGKHTLTPDGLLVVNPDGPHPIFQLIREAEAAWEAKLARSSKTLDEAVAEYRRRYRRAPPLGFDKWWHYVVKNGVLLPDEYDEIFEDIEPFLGIDPVELALTREALEVQEDLVTVEKTETRPKFEVVHSTLPESRGYLLQMIDDILKFVREIEEDLPPMHITMSPFDNPNLLSDWRIKTMALEAAGNGTTLTHDDLPQITEAGWIQACAPDSPARLHPPILPSRSTTPSFSPSPPKTFIASHRDTMDPCRHPHLLTTHGQFLSYNTGPFPRKTLIPHFSPCATLLHHDIRPPVPYGWDYDIDLDPHAAFEGDVPWEHKVDERLGWRGRTTGIYASPDSLWVHAHRERLVTLANMLEGNVSVLGVPKNMNGAGGGEESVPVGEPRAVRLASVNPAWMDIAFSDEPIACDKKNGTCDKMENLWEFRRIQKQHEQGRYKFVLDVDGHGWSGRFKRLISSNALIFKATIYPEWYLSRIQPWVHYIPIQVSYADLYDSVAFFRTHDKLAARIAEAGRDWSRRFWRRQDMTAYMYRLLLEYARVSSLDRASMDYVG